MKIDRTKIIIGLVILAIFQICILIFTDIFSAQNIKSNRIQKLLIKNLKKENIIFFSIKDYQDIFSVEKGSEGWIVKKEDGNKMPGNLSKIDSYLDIIINIPRGIVVNSGEDENIEKEFGFDSSRQQELTINTSDKKEYKIQIGSTGSKSNSSYIKFGKEKAIREVNSNISARTSNDAIDWSNKNIFNNLNILDVASCEIDSKFNWYKGSYKIIHRDSTSDIKGEYIIELNDNLKLNEDDNEKRLDKSNKLLSLVETIIGITAAEYKFGEITNKNKMGTIKFILKNGTFLTLDFFNADKDDIGNFIITTNFNDYKYLIHEDIANNIFKNYKDFE